jgi:hypothetical protein
MVKDDDLAEAGNGLSGIPHDGKRQAELYWRQVIQLKGAAVCIRLYRNRLGERLRAVEIVKAVAGSTAVSGWIVFHDYPFLWTCIIAAAQLLDAVKDVFPFSKLHKQAAALTVALELLLIDAEDEWEKVHIGQPDEKAIIEKRTRLRKLQIEAEHRHFPEGFEPPKVLVDLATEETQTYFQVMYSTEASFERP